MSFISSFAARPAGVLLLAICWLCISGCRTAEQSVPQAVLSGSASSIIIELSEPAVLRQVVVRRADGSLLQRLPVAGIQRQIELPVRLQADTDYLFTLCFSQGNRTIAWRSPPAGGPLLGLLEIPLGQRAVRLLGDQRAIAMASPEGTVSLAAVLENREPARLRYRLTFQLPPQIKFSTSDKRLDLADASQPLLEGELAIAGDFVQVTAQLTLSSGTQSATLVCELSVADTSIPDGDGWKMLGTTQIEIKRGDIEQLRQQIELVAIEFPSDLSGDAQPQYPQDAINLPNPWWNALRQTLRPTSTANPYEAYGWQSVTLRNSGDAALNLLVESEVAPGPGEAASLQFAPPVWYSSRRSATLQQVLRLSPQSTGMVRFPLHVEPGTTPGEYLRRLRVMPLGSTDPLLKMTRPLNVRAGRPTVALVTWATCLICLIVWCLVPWLARRWQKPLGTEGLALIGLVASVHFAISFAFRLVGDVSASLLGPLAIFVAGIGHEALSTAIVAALLVLLPRPGTFSLSVLTLFLLNAMFTGQLGISDFVFVMVSMIWGECLLALCGVTRGSAFRQPSSDAPAANLWRMAVALGVANFGTLVVQFCLVQVLHRLYYAAWYVVAVALITGLVYGGIGAALGTRLGYRIRRATR